MAGVSPPVVNAIMRTILYIELTSLNCNNPYSPRTRRASPTSQAVRLRHSRTTMVMEPKENRTDDAASLKAQRQPIDASKLSTSSVTRGSAMRVAAMPPPITTAELNSKAREKKSQLQIGRFAEN